MPLTLRTKPSGYPIGYFEDIDLKSPDHCHYYWFTPWHYMQWRQLCHQKTMKEAKQEFSWLRDQHQLISYIDGKDILFFISVETVQLFQYMADKQNWGINITSSSHIHHWWSRHVRVRHRWSRHSRVHQRWGRHSRVRPQRRWNKGRLWVKPW